MTMINLDDFDRVAAIDASGMRNRILALPAQCGAAYALGKAVRSPAGFAPQQIVVAGADGAVAGADILRGLLQGELHIPFEVVRNYTLPAYANERTLVVCCSVSGNGGEALSVFGAAAISGCALVALCAGGNLAQRAQASGQTAITYTWPHTSREAIGYGLFTLLGMFESMGLLRDYTADVAESIAVLTAQNSNLQPASRAVQNPAKRYAGQCVDRLPIFIGAGATAAVARRWKTQLNSNAKLLATSEELPDANHNLIVGFEHAAEIWRNALVIALRTSHDGARLDRRFDLTTRMMLGAGINQDTVRVQGTCPLAQVMGLVQFGDWMSYYAAVMKGIDPTPTEAIDMFKGELCALG